MKSKKTKFEIKPVPLTEEQIKFFVKHYNENGSFPGSKIPCTITGKLTTCVGPWMKKKVQEFGGAEQLLRKYVCRGVIKSVNKTAKEATKPVKEPSKKAKKEKGVNSQEEVVVYDIPKIDFFKTKTPLTDLELSVATSNTCFRPDVFLDNDRFCNGCEYYDVCTNTNRCIKTVNKKTARK